MNNTARCLIGLLIVTSGITALFPLLSRTQRPTRSEASSVTFRLDTVPDHEADIGATWHSESGERLPPGVLASQGSTEQAPSSERQTESWAAIATAIESSVYGRLDPDALLDAAELVLRLNPTPKAVPIPDPSGELRFQLIGAPEGLSSELRVAHSNKYDQVLALSITLKPPARPYYLEGVLRAELACRLQIWADDNGVVSDFCIQATALPHYRESKNQGLPYESGTIVEAVLYHVGDLQKLPTQGMKAIGLQNGEHMTWDIPVVLDGPQVPRTDRIEHFSQSLLKMYSRIRETR